MHAIHAVRKEIWQARLVARHQDEHFIPTQDRSLTGVWIAPDDATIETVVYG